MKRGTLLGLAALGAMCVGAALMLGGCLAFHAGPMAGEPAKATFAQVAGTRVRYTDTGAGPAVVLIHGFASSLETWDALVPELKKTHRVIALDLKGFGWTDRPAGDYSPPAQADMVLALLEARGVGRFAVVGHSFGASVALQIALKVPQRVTRVALYDAWVYDEQLPTFFLWARARGIGEALFGLFYDERPEDKIANAFYDPSIIPEKLIEDLEVAFARPGTKAAALAAVRSMRYHEWQARYREVDQPVLLLWGREDHVTPVGIGERLVKELRQARLVVYPRCGHLPMIEAMYASNAEILRFLREDRP
ncbi:MAG TPA: alpha/beta fold hydrolase [Polyangia bacterium]